MKRNEITVTFYAEHTDDPKTWASPKPDFDLEGFNKELVKRTGKVHGFPRYRCRWAGNVEDYVIEEYTTLEGYVYRKDGIEKFVSCKDTDFEFPDGAVPSPYFETHKIYIPRFVIEEYNGHAGYNKLWTVERLNKTKSEYGRIDCLSFYRVPSEIDIRMIEQLRHLRDTLNNDDIRNGRARQEALEARWKAHEDEQLKAEILEDVEKAIKDGIPNASRFGFDPHLKFDIKQHTKNLIKEHDKKI